MLLFQRKEKLKIYNLKKVNMLKLLIILKMMVVLMLYYLYKIIIKISNFQKKQFKIALFHIKKNNLFFLSFFYMMFLEKKQKWVYFMLIVHNLSLQMCFVLRDINVSTVFCLRDEAHLRHFRPRRQRIVWAVVIDDKLQLPFLIGEGKHNDIFVVIFTRQSL